jgi:hypothetical protein
MLSLGRRFHGPCLPFYVSIASQAPELQLVNGFRSILHNNAPETLKTWRHHQSGDHSFVNSLTYRRRESRPPYWFQKRSELYSWWITMWKWGRNTSFCLSRCHVPTPLAWYNTWKERMEMAGEYPRIVIGSPKLPKFWILHSCSGVLPGQSRRGLRQLKRIQH